MFKTLDGLHTMTSVAKTLKVGRTKFFKGLRELGILNSDNTPKDEYKSKGLYCVSNPIGKYSIIGHSLTTHVSDEGVCFLEDIINKNPGFFGILEIIDDII